jgi:threonine/homoserine/homoserine lactone efflux protein
MSYGAFFIQAMLISLSGVMGPGPLTVVVVGEGARSVKAGALISLGHAVVEFPLMALIAFGFAPILQRPLVGAVIGLAGGLLLLWMGLGMLRSLRLPQDQGATDRRYATPFVAGILMSAGNPYFLVWWATVGATLVLRAKEFGLPLFIVFAVSHWSLDLIWYHLLSWSSNRGVRVMGPRFLKGVGLVAGVLLLFFGIRFVIDSLPTLL